MKKHNFNETKGRKNPYTKYLKQPITIRLDQETIDYFKALAAETDMPYQTIINLYLRDCVTHQRKLDMKWVTEQEHQP